MNSDKIPQALGVLALVSIAFIAAVMELEKVFFL